MKALVLYELHFYRDVNGEYWSKRLVDYTFLDRYISVFEEISICARVAHIDQAEKSMMKVSGPRVSFVELPDTQGMSETLKKLPEIKKIFRKALMESDVLITRAPTMLTMLLYKEIKKSKILYSVDVALSGLNLIQKSGFVWDQANQWIDRRLKKICMEANGVSYVTEYVLQQKYPCRSMKEPDNANYFTSSFSTIEMNDQHYYKQNWNKDKVPEKFILVHTGFMDDERKCQDVVLKAVSKVIEQGYNVEIRFIGDGLLRQKYEQMAKELGIRDCCQFCGLISEKEALLNELRKCHLFVFPTKAEGLPRAVLEAMAQGLPCISSPVDGVPELLESEYLVDWWDADGFAKKICELLSDWGRMVDQSEANYHKSLNYHNDILKVKRHDFYSKLYQLCKKKTNIKD